MKKVSEKIDYITIDCGPERGINNESTFKDCKEQLSSKNFKLLSLNSDSTRITALFKNNLFIQ